MNEIYIDNQPYLLLFISGGLMGKFCLGGFNYDDFSIVLLQCDVEPHLGYILVRTLPLFHRRGNIQGKECYSKHWTNSLIGSTENTEGI